MRGFFRKIFPYVFLFIISFVLLYPVFVQGRFLDGDIFYHVKMAMLMKDGVIHSFNWLPLTTFSDGFVDHHFLYHVVLIPFVTFFDPMVGAWIVQWIFVSLIFIVIYMFARRFDFSRSWALLTSLIPATTLVFVMRMSNPKAIPLSILWYLAIIYCLVFNRLWILFLICFFYVWLYGGWPIAVVCACVYSAIKFFYERKYIESFKPAGIVLLAVSLGLIINPYFPENISFYYDQIIRIAIFNDTSFLLFGSEWIGFDSLSPFVFYMTIPFFILVLGVSFFITGRKNFSAKTLFMLVITGLLFMMNVKSRRYVEYFVPSSAILAIFLLNDFCRDVIVKSVADFIKKNSSRRVLIICGILFFVFYGYASLASQWLNRSGGDFSVEMYRGAGEWLREKVAKGEVIGHLSWTEFPLLFYYDHDHRYLSGLDPRYLAYENFDLAVKYNDLMSGKITDPITVRDLFVHDFGSRYVVVNQSADIVNEKLIKLFQDEYADREAYKDEFVRIYHLLP